MSQKKRYVQVGTGKRGLGMFAKPLLRDFSATGELVGVMDSNPVRMAGFVRLLGRDVPMFTDFDAMLKAARPDGVIVSSMDCTHAEYVIRSLKAGLRVYCEKPLCTTVRQCVDIAAAAAGSRGIGFVTHNMRYTPACVKVKELLDGGKIGRLISMEFRENLDRRHGANYFHRWHRFKANSGGLLIHKASHHFDLLNWLAGSRVRTLTAMGSSAFYGRNGAFRGPRCSACPHAGECDFHIDLSGNELAQVLYIQAERADGYLRDACVFDERIDVEDQASALFTYANGVHVTYALKAYACYEGYSMAFEGTLGRLEYSSMEDTSWVQGGQVDFGAGDIYGERLMFFPARDKAEAVEIPQVEGSHGGSDPQLRRDFFAAPWDAPPPRMASLDEAVQAVIVGAAANASIAAGGKPIDVQGLLKS